jgi:tripartite-type tricarboxylate transporter receptor subunit TctC
MTHPQTTSPVRREILLAAVAATLTPWAQAQGAPWPNRPVKVVVSSAAGGPTDLFARLFAEQMSKTFGQPFVVENRVGANGLIGNDAVAKSAPDGYTLLFTFAAAVAMNHALLPKLPYDTFKDLQPVAQIGATGTLLAVTPSFPANNIREFIDHVKANPGKFNYGSWGQGSGGHLSMEALSHAAGLKLNHVPYKSIPQVITDMLNGNLQVAFVDPFTPMQHIRSGKIRPLMISGTRRGPALPDVPTMTEVGYRFDADAWFGLFFPGGTPGAITQRVNEEVARFLRLPDTAARFTALNMPFSPIKTVEQFTQTVKDDVATWSAIIKTANIKPE